MGSDVKVERFKCADCKNDLMHELEHFGRDGYREKLSSDQFERYVQCAVCGNVWLLGGDTPKFVRRIDTK